MAITHISPKDAQALLELHPDYALIDVREPEEFEELSVPGSISIPLTQMLQRKEELNGYGGICFLCESGGRSMQACFYADSVGLPNIYNIEGGIGEWHREHLPKS